MNDKAWLTQSDIPPPRTEAKILAFFGIPPGALEDLDEHIDRKRRSWHAKRNGVSRTGRDRAKAVLDLIDQMSKNVKRGVPVELVVGEQLVDDRPEAVERERQVVDASASDMAQGSA